MITKEYIIRREDEQVKATALNFENALTLFEKMLNMEKEHKKIF